MEERLSRTALLIGEEAIGKLQNSHVMLFGLGGVGGYALEALARGGVGKLTLVDFDSVSESNLNRQILATRSTVGLKKTDVAAARVREIAPGVAVLTHEIFVDRENAAALIAGARPDYIIDAIDAVAGKLGIILAAKEAGIPVISSMGTGNKLDPTRFRITDIGKTHTCPLARAMRVELRRLGVAHVDVLWSDELPVTPAKTLTENGKSIPASISYVPSAAGLIIGGYVLRKLAAV